jgi:hypothetical protein
MIVIRGVNIYHAKDIAFCAIKFNCGCGGGDVFICSKLVENVTLSVLAVLCLLSKSRRFCAWKDIVPARGDQRKEASTTRAVLES